MERLGDEDIQFNREFYRGGDKEAPIFEDWENMRAFIKFLKTFYDATLKFSGSLYSTSNTFLHQLSLIRTQINTWANRRDTFLKIMAGNMGRKYNKYWGSLGSINPILLVAVLLDPRHKEAFLKYCLGTLFVENIVTQLTIMVRQKLNDLYDQYNMFYCGSSTQTVITPRNENANEVDSEVDVLFTFGFMRLLKESNNKDCKTEVDMRLLKESNYKDAKQRWIGT